MVQNHIRKILLLQALLICSVAMSAQTAADKVLGRYRMTSIVTDDTAIVEVTKTDAGTYRGRLVWLNHPTNADGTVRRDEKNKDPKLRTRTYDKVYLCWGLAFDGEEWTKGKLYDPFSGNTFSIKLKWAKNHRDLEARYYKGVPAVGLTRTWVRVK